MPEEEKIIEEIKRLCTTYLGGEVKEEEEDGTYIVYCKLPYPTTLMVDVGASGIVFGSIFPVTRVRIPRELYEEFFIEAWKPTEHYDIHVDLPKRLVSHTARGVFESFAVYFTPKKKSLTIALK